MMMDYMLPNKVMSWAEAWEVYYEEAGGALFKDLARYGIEKPKYSEVLEKEKNHISHQAWWIFYNFGHAAGFHTFIPSPEELDWLSEKYPDTFDKYYRPRWELAQKMEDEGKRFYSSGLPQLCQVCQVPMTFTDMANNPGEFTYRASEYDGERYHMCSDGCLDIFNDEPEKYVQAWLPVQQILQGNCGGPGLEEVLSEYYRINVGVDNMDFKGSADQKNWEKWKNNA